MRQQYNPVVEAAESAPDDAKDADKHDDKGETYITIPIFDP